MRGTIKKRYDMDQITEVNRGKLSRNSGGIKDNYARLISQYNMRVTDDRCSDFRSTLKEIINVGNGTMVPRDKRIDDPDDYGMRMKNHSRNKSFGVATTAMPLNTPIKTIEMRENFLPDVTTWKMATPMPNKMGMTGLNKSFKIGSMPPMFRNRPTVLSTTAATNMRFGSGAITGGGEDTPNDLSFSPYVKGSEKTPIQKFGTAMRASYLGGGDTERPSLIIMEN